MVWKGSLSCWRRYWWGSWGCCSSAAGSRRTRPPGSARGGILSLHIHELGSSRLDTVCPIKIVLWIRIRWIRNIMDFWIQKKYMDPRGKISTKYCKKNYALKIPNLNCSKTESLLKFSLSLIDSSSFSMNTNEKNTKKSSFVKYSVNLKNYSWSGRIRDPDPNPQQNEMNP